MAGEGGRPRCSQTGIDHFSHPAAGATTASETMNYVYLHGCPWLDRTELLLQLARNGLEPGELEVVWG
jgi:hypothetical protein